MSENNTGTSKKIQTWVLLIIIISVSGYNVVSYIKEKREKEAIWTQQDLHDVVERCIKDTGERGKDFPELTAKYCECSTQSITAVISKKEYISLIKQPIDVQSEKLTPLFKNCLDDYLAKVTQLERQEK